jgi:hypothetical protein
VHLDSTASIIKGRYHETQIPVITLPFILTLLTYKYKDVHMPMHTHTLMKVLVLLGTFKENLYQ